MKLFPWNNNKYKTDQFLAKILGKNIYKIEIFWKNKLKKFVRIQRERKFTVEMRNIYLLVFAFPLYLHLSYSLCYDRNTLKNCYVCFDYNRVLRSHPTTLFSDCEQFSPSLSSFLYKTKMFQFYSSCYFPCFLLLFLFWLLSVFFFFLSHFMFLIQMDCEE